MVRYVTRKYHPPPAEAEEFASAARLKLIEDDYAVFRKFAGRSSLRTYLTAVLLRLFLDRRVHEWGRWRPSAAARRLGELAVTLETLLYRDGRSLDEAAEIVRLNLGRAVPRRELEDLAARLPRRERRRVTTTDELPEEIPSGAGADDELARSERAAEAQRIGAALHACVSGLDAEDRLILRMRFEDGWRVGQIAAALHAEEKPLYRRLERLLLRLREGLLAQGVGSADVADVLGRCDVEWAAPPRPGNGAGASVQPDEGARR